jgi:hypothetical protein
MNHKRKRPKHQRAGCLMCKPHKDERGKNSIHAQKLQVQKLEPIEKLYEDDYKENECVYCKGELCLYDDCDCGNMGFTQEDGTKVHFSCIEIVNSGV